MSYEGVKYRTIIESADLPSDPRIEEIRKWCMVFHEKNLAPYYPGGTHGNMSFRLKPGEDSFVITAARSSFAEYLSADSFFTITRVLPEEMAVYAYGALLREPSSETLLHHAIYKARPDVHTILHGHCESISRNSEKMGVPTTKEFVESGTVKIVASVLEILDDHHFIEIRDHGFMAMAKTIDEAGELAMKMLEKSQLF